MRDPRTNFRQPMNFCHDDKKDSYTQLILVLRCTDLHGKQTSSLNKYLLSEPISQVPNAQHASVHSDKQYPKEKSTTSLEVQHVHILSMKLQTEMPQITQSGTRTRPVTISSQDESVHCTSVSSTLHGEETSGQLIRTRNCPHCKTLFSSSSTL
jgi:hypothetical protein